MMHTVTVETPTAIVMIVGHIIRLGIGRSDLALRIDGKDIDTTLVFSDGDTAQWVDAQVTHIASLGKGDHRISLYADGGNGASWGCQKEWGAIDVVIIGE